MNPSLKIENKIQCECVMYVCHAHACYRYWIWSKRKKKTRSFQFHFNFISFSKFLRNWRTKIGSFSSFPRNLFTHWPGTATSLSWETHEYQMDSNRAMALHTVRDLDDHFDDFNTFLILVGVMKIKNTPWVHLTKHQTWCQRSSKLNLGWIQNKSSF